MANRSLRSRSVVLLGAVLAAGLVLVVPAPVQAAASTPVMGASEVTAADLAGFFRSKGKVSQATVSIDDLAAAFIEEGAAEGVAGDLAFAQSIVETGWFTFSTRVPPSFNNFSGLGAVDGGSSAASFSSARIGVRAQIQHLRAYADPTVTTAKLANPLVDPRFSLVLPKGKAPTWEQFGNGIWATDPGYAAKVLSIHDQIVAYAAANHDDRWEPFASAGALVDRGYDDLLARTPTTGERTSAIAALEGGTSSSTVLGDLVAGEGADHGGPVARLYLAGLGRLPDPSGMRYWVVRHRDGLSIRRLADQFLASGEYDRRYGQPDDAGYIDLLYRNVLGRPSDPSGTDYWGRRLAAGVVTRSELLVQFSESAEYVRTSAATTEAAIVYLGMLGRAPDPSALSWWSTKRSTGSELPVLVGMVFSSSAYQARVS